MKKRLTLSLDEDVWNRLKTEAAARDMSIGAFAAALITARDDRRHGTPGAND